MQCTQSNFITLRTDFCVLSFADSVQRKTGKHGGKEVSVQLGADPWNSQPAAAGEGEASGTGTDIEEMELYEELH